MTSPSVADSLPVEKIPTPAENARYMAALHRVACRYRAQGLRCSMCHDANERADRLTRQEREASHVER